ncbi:MAG: hypothetical protein ACKOA8_16850, partial [Deltaproteobacteria bacterium]
MQVIASIVIYILTIVEINGPLTYDEMNIGGALAIRSLSEVLELIYSGVHRLTNTQHTLSSLTAFTAMSLFGKNEWVMRSASLPYALLFLIVAIRFCRKFIPTGFSIFIFANILVNQNILFYLHSARGFISMLLFSLLSLTILLDVSENRFPSSRKNYISFSLVYFFLILTNTNGGLFALYLFLTLLTWTLFNHSNIPKESLKTYKTFLRLMALNLPLFFMGALRETQVQAGLAQLHGSNPEWNFGTMGYLLGWDRIWWSKLFLFFCVSLFLFRINKFDIKKDFLTLFLSV